MDNHGHLLIDANGADISRIMHSINQCYEQYFNRKYKRHGHVFQDRYNIVDAKYILQMFSSKLEKAKKLYKEFINKYEDEVTENDVEFTEKNTEYISERVILKRDAIPENIVAFVSTYTKIDKRKIFIKYNRESTNSKALCAFLMRRFCNFSHKDICKMIGNITQARISSLCFKGMELILNEKNYNAMLEEFLVV